MSSTAFITGIAGQDGAYLARLLLEKGYHVVGGYRRSASSEYWRLQALGIAEDVDLVPFELLEFSNILHTLERKQPDEVYNLAAQSFVATSFEQPVYTSNTNAMGVIRLLETIRTVNPGIRFYQASTSEMFGKSADGVQSESTPFHPRSPYGIAKVFAYWTTVNYREAYGMHASNGILFNHESPLRGSEFVTRKITRSIARIRLGRQKELVLGNTAARRDWGFAGDYVEAMWKMVQQPEGGDYVIATGQAHSVEELVNAAAACADLALRWRGQGVEREAIDANTGRVVVRVDPAFFRPAEVDALRGDASKAREILDWRPTVGFEELVAMMVESDLEWERRTG